MEKNRNDRQSSLLTLIAVIAIALAETACGGNDKTATTQGQTKPAISPPPQNQPAGDSRLRGIDISRYQVVANWADVKNSGVAFVFVKATEGLSEIDPDFTRYWAALQEQGIARGAYHFFRPEDDPVKQALHFVSTVSLQADDLPPVVDIEVSDGINEEELSKNLQVWISTVAEKVGKRPIIYTGNAFWNKYSSDQFGVYPLWVAEYGVEKPRIPKGWTDWHFWQYAAAGSIQGINGQVDHNYFNGSLTDLKQFSASPVSKQAQ